MEENKPLLVGITGGIGSGKSTVCKVFELLGIPVYYADDRAKQITSIDPELKDQICQRFGEDSYIGNDLNRTYLAQKVFADKAALNALNALIHPRVALDFDKWVSANKHHPYLLKEAALIFETKGNLKLDKVITV
ncbi:MAG: dephospho-CoA kinase, partial [Bacteroidota bacterium]